MCAIYLIAQHVLFLDYGEAWHKTGDEPDLKLRRDDSLLDESLKCGKFEKFRNKTKKSLHGHLISQPI